MSLGRDVSKSAPDAISAVAAQLHVDIGANLQARNAIDTSKPFDVKAEAGASASAIVETGDKLDQVADIRQALTAQLGAEQKQSVGPDPSGGRGGVIGNVMKAGAALGLGFVLGGPAGAAVGMAAAIGDAAKFAAKAVAAPAGFEHAGLQHAILNPGASHFGSIKASSKDDGPDPAQSYTDSMGSTWNNGFRAMPGVTPQFSVRPNDPRYAADLMNAAGKVVGERGADEVAKELSGVTKIEQKLGMQMKSAVDRADDIFGTDLAKSLDAKYAVRPPTPAGPGMAGPGPKFFG